jgi:protein phosphatase
VTTIPVPDPSLVLLVGAAGAGKTTFAARHFAPDEVLSSDAYRALVSGDEANQKVSRVAFSILHRDLEHRLAEGRLTVVDATNVEPRNRRELIRRAHAAGVPVVALVLDLPPAVVLARNAGRARVVDEEVVRWQLERVRTSAEAGVLAREGCVTVWIGRTPEAIDGVTVLRVAAAGDGVPSALSPTLPPRPR